MAAMVWPAAYFGILTALGYALGFERHLYTGREFDHTTGLQFNRRRWYDPQTGRWLSEDPLGLGPDANPYRYVYNSPPNFTDPTGEGVFLLLVPLAIYASKVLRESAIETGVEWAVAEATGDETFDFWTSFGRNLGVNAALGWIPGATEAKIGAKATTKLGRWAAQDGRAEADSRLPVLAGAVHWRHALLRFARPP